MTEWSASSGSPWARRLVAVAVGAAGVAAEVEAEGAGAARAAGAAWAAGAASAREAAEEGRAAEAGGTGGATEGGGTIGAAESGGKGGEREGAETGGAVEGEGKREAVEGGGTGGATWGGGKGEAGEGGGTGEAGEARVAAVVPAVAGRAAVASAAPAPRRWNSGMGCRRAVLAGDPPAEAAENDSAWMAATSGGGPSAAMGVEGRGGKTVGRAVARAGSAASWGRSAPSGSQTAGRFDIALRPLFFFFFFFYIFFFYIFFFIIFFGEWAGNESNAAGTGTIAAVASTNGNRRDGKREETKKRKELLDD